jgi:adenylate cyclase class 2
MTATGQEIEVKFYLRDMEGLQKRLAKRGARMVQKRVHEINLRFDTPDHTLLQSGEVLRLRQDTEVRLTFKGQGEEQAGARKRQELEFTVSDFATTRQVLEALGFEAYMMYEKYRTTYRLGSVLVTLDEMPYGNFSEIEGPDGEMIQRIAQALNLDWEKRSLDSYTLLFERVKQALGLTFEDLSFKNFEGVEVTGEMLGVRTAD